MDLFLRYSPLLQSGAERLEESRRAAEVVVTVAGPQHRVEFLHRQRPDETSLKRRQHNIISLRTLISPVVAFIVDVLDDDVEVPTPILVDLFVQSLDVRAARSVDLTLHQQRFLVNIIIIP